MKKTVNINLGGMVFHIDEDAYFNTSLVFKQQFCQNSLAFV
jgi:hypothetical protein